MSRYVARPYAGESDLHSLIRFAQRITRACHRRPSYYHPGDFVWQLYEFDSSDDVRIWRVGGAIVACAVFEPPLMFQFDLDPAFPDQVSVMRDVVAWAEQRRASVAATEGIPLAYRRFGSNSLATSAMDTDPGRVAFLMENGYVQDEQPSFRLVRRLDGPLPPVVLPARARFRHMSDADAEARAELHRDAWSVWGASKHTTEIYGHLRAAPLYDRDLDVVLECEGRLVSYCVCWLDTANHIGLFEPVGTRPSAARRGFARAVIHEAFRRLRDKGMNSAVVSTGVVNKPAMALYASAGFEEAARDHSYVKPI